MTMVPDVQRALTAPIRELPTEHAKRYQAKLEGYRADYEPRGTLENDLVAEMAHLVLQLEQTRAVAAAVAAIRVETAAAAVGQGPFRDDRDARLAALHLQTLAFDPTPDGERLRRHYGACERALHRTIATFLKLRKAAPIAGCNTTETEREYGQAGYNDGTTAGRAGDFASAPHTVGSNEEDDERDPAQNTDAAFKLVVEAAVAAQRKPKTASKRLDMALLERAIVAQAKEIHRLELFEQARDDFYHRRGNQPFSRKPWHPDPRLTGELAPCRNSRIERNGRNS
jgi:hypothetical protein